MKLSISDIVDLRQYERQRDEFRQSVIALKKLRRVSLGDLVTIVFENKDTIRFQIQEMARAEKMLRDEQIETELEIYNPLIPEVGELKATLFLELTSKGMLEKWLPALVGIEKTLYLQFGDISRGVILYSQSEKSHESQLIREEVTASVHYIEWTLDDDLVREFSAEKVYLGIDHPKYKFQVELTPECKGSLVADWNI